MLGTTNVAEYVPAIGRWVGSEAATLPMTPMLPAYIELKISQFDLVAQMLCSRVSAPVGSVRAGLLSSLSPLELIGRFASFFVC